MPTNPYVRFKTFRGTFATWQQLFSDAAEFATRIGAERLITISHSADHSEGVVTVWFWAPAQDSAD
jgi:hypothetical protein